MSARAAVEAALARIEALEAELGSLLDVDEDGARERADLLDRESHPRGPLHGVPFFVKANLCWRGRATSAGSRMLEGYRPPYDATALARLVEAGAIPLGSCNMDEFGFGSSGSTRASVRRATLGTSRAPPADRRAAARPPSPRASSRSRSPPTRAAPYASPPRCAARAASSRATGAFRAMD